jgi:hypothetical protein
MKLFGKEVMLIAVRKGMAQIMMLFSSIQKRQIIFGTQFINPTMNLIPNNIIGMLMNRVEGISMKTPQVQESERG